MHTTIINDAVSLGGADSAIDLIRRDLVAVFPATRMVTAGMAVSTRMALLQLLHYDRFVQDAKLIIMSWYAGCGTAKLARSGPKRRREFE